MTPPAWLLVAAAVLALTAGWCARGEAALTLMSATGAAERPDPKRADLRRPDLRHPDLRRTDLRRTDPAHTDEPGRAGRRRPGDRNSLRIVAADPPRYLSVLLLIRAVCEVFAAVLVTAAFVSWFGDNWRAVFSALAVVLALRYALTGVRSQASAAGPRAERTAERAAVFLVPLTRALGPLPRLLVAVGQVMPPGRRKAISSPRPTSQVSRRELFTD